LNRLPMKKLTGPRLRESLRLLVRVNNVRHRREVCREKGVFAPPWASLKALRTLEAALEQNDADGREKVDARQLGLFTNPGNAGVPEAKAS
jgi:hypothetical protein